jgi:DNA-binding NtrC family response regulator
MWQDKTGQFYIAATHGLFRFDPAQKQKFKRIRSGYAWKISLLEDHQGMLWVGSSGDGVERYNPHTETWDLYKNDPQDSTSISNNFVECIYEDHAGILWFATAGGLNKFDRENETFRHYREKDGLVQDWIYGILEARQGYLWLSTARGLSRFDPKTETFKNYMTKTNNYNQFSRGAYHKSSKGEFFFGGVNGLNSFYPQKITNNPYIPPIVITRISLFNQKVNRNLLTGKQIALAYDQNFLSFDFTALDYTDPEENQFAYIMEGLDNDWIYSGTRKHVDYPDLKPGNYLFRVKGTNNDGVWNEEGSRLRISINPPFWQTWWFRTALISCIFMTLYYLYRKRIQIIESKRKDLEIRVREKSEAAQALQNALDEVESLKNRLQVENIYLQDEIKNVHNFENIITKSESFKKILRSVEQVASTDATVLILGESGTGKELIARAVHNISSRGNRPLLKVNCAALPANLIESELFGHEKGAFTGAIANKVGRFELANNGTIFLDEIGDLPLELQSKLLRVLQEGEFERLGNPVTINVDVRVIAATNRDLEKEIKTGQFREDLFYRLNVFPIKIPPLRERKEDISLLVNDFIKKYSAKVGKHIDSVTVEILKTLESYYWPGNVRELENVIERAVIISPGPKLIIGDWLEKSKYPSEIACGQTLEEVEKKYITEVLEKTGWRVSGDNGAAKILGIKRTTLEARMQKLGIKRNK